MVGILSEFPKLVYVFQYIIVHIKLEMLLSTFDFTCNFSLL